MQRFSSFLLFLVLSFMCMGQEKITSSIQTNPKSTDIFYKLGEDIITIKVLQYGTNKDFFFINLHDDEVTAIAGATRFLKLHGGTFVRIANNRNRNIRFRLNGRYFAFDPNRIFSRTGIIQTLRTFGPISNKAIEELQKFAQRILQLLPPRPACIIALHNNSDGKFSVTSYFRGHEREKDAKAIHLAPRQDPDDLFLTTDSVLFRYLSREKFNAVWQDNARAFKDGSLSIYCGENNLCYLNCETEHGRLSQYVEMISVAMGHVKKLKPSEERRTQANFLYRYQLSSPSLTSPLPNDFAVYFGDRKIGMLKSFSRSDSLSPGSGQMEIIQSFPLYDNMDFFFFERKNVDKIELRIDPTRPRRLLDRDRDKITIQVVP